MNMKRRKPIEWAFNVIRDLAENYDKEILRHLAERLATYLTPEQRELLVARIELIHTSPQPDESVIRRFGKSRAA